MADEHSTHQDHEAPVIRDKRRFDPQTGELRDPPAAAAAGGPPAAGAAEDGTGAGGDVIEDTIAAAAAATTGAVHPDTALAAERLLDMQRLQAEYVNYKRRVDRDRDLHRDIAVASVVEALLPVLDDLHLARQHGDLEGTPFNAIADKLDTALGRFGVERFGQPGETFDPAHHEALMHVQAELAEGTDATTVVQVLQPGYRINDRVIRAARVSVADPG